MNYSARFKIASISLTLLSLTSISSYATLPIDVSHQSVGYMQNLVSSAQNAANASLGSKVNVMSRSNDNMHMTHVRFKQTYRGFDVWGAEMMMHIPNANVSLTNIKNTNFKIPANAFSNGLIYDKLENDLGNAPTDNAYRQNLADKMAQEYLKSAGVNGTVSKIKVDTIVYIMPETNKATWAYSVDFTVMNSNRLIANPTIIVDAQSQNIYQQWDKIEYSSEETVNAGGLGGNLYTGKLSYDDHSPEYPSFKVDRISSSNPFDKDFRGNCYLRNAAVNVLAPSLEDRPYFFPCHQIDAAHNNLYWDDAFGSAHDGYSPVNDAMQGVRVVFNLYKDWYGIPTVTGHDHVNPMQMIIKIDDTDSIFPTMEDNAFWTSDGDYLQLGRGGLGYYPFTSIYIMAHELSHAFTSQHANLTYSGGSGAMNEAYSDMATQALEYYLTGTNTWRIGKEVIEDPSVRGCTDTQDCALRYMDDPKKDGKSFDDVTRAMTQVPNVHYSSGVFNKLFYLIATSQGWNTRMAFNVMERANAYYWIAGDGTSHNYKPIACGIISAAKDFHAQDAQYNVTTVVSALKAIGFKDDGLPVQYPYYDYDIRDCE